MKKKRAAKIRNPEPEKKATKRHRTIETGRPADADVPDPAGENHRELRTRPREQLPAPSKTGTGPIEAIPPRAISGDQAQDTPHPEDENPLPQTAIKTPRDRARMIVKTIPRKPHHPDAPKTAGVRPAEVETDPDPAHPLDRDKEDPQRMKPPTTDQGKRDGTTNDRATEPDGEDRTTTDRIPGAEAEDPTTDRGSTRKGSNDPKRDATIRGLKFAGTITFWIPNRVSKSAKNQKPSHS